MNTWVRDTLIKADDYNNLPAERQLKISALVYEYKSSGYIDARTEIGPDQYARMSKKQRDKISATASRVFAIEGEIKLLMRSDAQIIADEQKEQAKQLAEKIQKLKYSIRNFEDFCSRKINSKRDNATKREYLRLKAELAQLQPA